MKPPLFIIGCGRTGSKMHYYSLRSHSKIGIGGEMNLLNPWYLFFGNNNLKKLKNMGDISKKSNLKEAVNLCFSKELKGAFWKYSVRKSLTKEEVLNEMKLREKNYKNLIKVLLYSYAKVQDASIPGSKFPLHFFYTPLLKKWFPNCKIIHAIRDPRAILASELKKENKPRLPISKNNPWYKVSIFNYTLIQWIWAVDSHFEYKKKYGGNYLLMKFENFLDNPKNNLRKFCDFLEIDYEKSMVENVKVKGSSFNSDSDGFDKRAIDRWRKNLPKNYKKIYDLILKRKMKKIGYL